MNKREIQDWLVARIAGLLQIAPDSVDTRESFSHYGLSSLDVVTLSGDLETLLGRRLSATVAYDYPNILALAGFLAEDVGNGESFSTEKSSANISSEPIAIIGIGCRFPRAKNPEAFWQLLRDGVDAISEVPADRWQKQAFFHADPAIPGKSISYWGGLLDRVDQFDPFFFGISPVEAQYMDPQQRLLLELSYEALDDAGEVIEKLDGSKTGVFIGISVNEYSQLQFGDPSQITAHSGTGSALSIAANRISYFFNFRGPSIAIDTACSSSLSAVHLACQSLRNGECKMALAGGVNIILSPAHSIAFTKAGLLARDGRCKSFDASADGYVRGEGGGIIVLKPLAAALADGDPIQALIRGSAMSQDGRTNGLMAPNREAQEALLREAYQVSGVSPNSVQYVEAHGTGTLLGDSMEAQALGTVIGANRTNGACAIGSVKSNIGHLESAAGIAGLIKVILSLQHHTIPPSLHYYSPNPHISFSELNLKVQEKLHTWPLNSAPSLAGVSSFGFGGTNVHVVVQEAGINEQAEKINKEIDSDSSGFYLLPLSANNQEALRSLTGTFKELLTDNFTVSTRDICYAASVRRSRFDRRLAVIGHSRKELHNGLQAFLEGKQDPHLLLDGAIIQGQQSKLAFVFSGHGGQWLGMGRELLSQEPVFYNAIERIDHVIQANFGWSLIKVLYTNEFESRPEEIDVIQPTLFAIQVALAELWQSWGITPDAVIGHSMGEIAAAHIAGILNLEDAIAVVCCRSQLLKRLRGKGSMLVTELSPEQAKEYIQEYENDVTIAAINSPTSTILSGNPERIKEVMDSLQHQQLFCKLVNVDVASHSRQMDGLRPELLKALRGLNPQPSKTPFYSTVTGAREDNLCLDADYWIDNLRKPVLFSAAIRQLLHDGYTCFMEISPHPVLLSSIQQSAEPRHPNIRLFPSLRRNEPEREVLLGTLGALYTHGFSIAWQALYPNGGKYVHLPLIPWQHQRYWIDTKPAGSKNPWHALQANEKNAHPLLGERMALANSPSTFVWQTTINDEVLIFLRDHRIHNEMVFPAAGYIEMALQAAVETGLNKSHVLSDVIFKHKLVVQSGKPMFIQTILSPDKKGNFHFSIYSRTTPQDNWTLHADASFMLYETVDITEASIMSPPDIVRQQSTSELTAEAFYSTLQSRGLQYGAMFRSVQHIWNKGNESLGQITLPESSQYDTNAYQIPPALLDACLQVIAATQNASFEYNFFFPIACKYIRFFSQPKRELWSHVSLKPEYTSGADIIEVDIKLSDENNQTIAAFIGFRLQRTSRRARHLLSQQDTWLYQLSWQPQKALCTLPVDLRERKHWLIFADDEGVGEELARCLEASGDHCYLLSYKGTSRRLENASENAFSEIIEHLLEAIPSPLSGIVHLWSLSTPPQSSVNSETTDNMQVSGCNSVLLLVQALAGRMAGSARLWLVTTNTQAVIPGEPIAVEQSPLCGLGKVISFELPELKCIRIDLDSHQPNVEAASLLLEQLSLDDQEDQIAFRAGVRYVLRLLPFSFTIPSGSTPFSLRTDGTYVITGALGGLGLETAKWMAQRGARHLVLLGRKEASPAAMTAVEKIRNEGVEVTIMQADVSNWAQLEHVFKKIEQNMPVLRGMIHAAGVLDDGSLLNLSPARMRSVMAPKVDGTWNLHKITLHLPLDFFVLYSSAVSVLGSPGQGNYAAASAYLDGMAHYRRSLGLPAISINWGPWAEVGLAAETTERLNDQNVSNQHLIKMIKTDRGLEILEHLLSESTAQVMVLPFDLKNLIGLYPTAAGMPFLAEVGGSDSPVARLYARPNLRQQYVAPRNEMERKLAALWQQTLHINNVGILDSFFELGGDSVLAAQILSLTQKTFGTRINPQDAFKAFTIERLAAMLEREILKQVEEMSDEEAQQLLSKSS